MKIAIKAVLLFILVNNLFAQIKDYELGANLLNRTYQQSGYFDLSDPEAVNIKVAIWGWVRYPGRYVIPNYTTISDLISYSGGPLEGADLEDIRVLRTKDDDTQELIKLTYNDIIYANKIDFKNQKILKLQAGDIVVLPGEPRLYARDKVAIWTSILSLIISLTILVLNITKK
ncbi:MAG: SLBB domain-containing protein [Melioribacteraceae bacterium]|nr:SLBB domain-containing protein [Melioribacteraceae bacterium]